MDWVAHGAARRGRTRTDGAGGRWWDGDGWDGTEKGGPIGLGWGRIGWLGRDPWLLSPPL
jgi:hypothetical protein